MLSALLPGGTQDTQGWDYDSKAHCLQNAGHAACTHKVARQAIITELKQCPYHRQGLHSNQGNLAIWLLNYTAHSPRSVHAKVHEE